MKNGAILLLFALVPITIGLVFWWQLNETPLRTERLSDLPWQIDRHEDGSTSVFGLRLGSADFGNAVAKFGAPESVAVFADAGGPRSLEAYFGKVTLGRMDARVIVNLEAERPLLEDLAERALEREPQPSGSTRMTLPPGEWEALASRPLAGITYIPEYGGLDEDFIRARFGEPAVVAHPAEGQVQLSYPERGVTILVDAGGKEMFEYSPVR